MILILPTLLYQQQLQYNLAGGGQRGRRRRKCVARYRNSYFLIKYVQYLRRAPVRVRRTMGKIELTNIIIDDFSIAKRETNKIYTHILTHIHTDHLKGLTDGWNYGPVYCTQLTKQMLLQKFPSLTCLNALPLETPTVIKMSPSLEVTVTFFDANHCFGAAMVLLEGYMGTVLYTGDIRFDRAVFQKYELLYPPELTNEDFVGCSRQIDLLYLDNTFLKKKFDFPKREPVLAQTLAFIRELIERNEHTRIYVALDTYGKEEVVEYVAKELDVYIVVDEQKYEILRAMGRDLELYTTNFDEGFIQVIAKRRMAEYLEKDPLSICFVLSGWVNHASYRNNNRIYCLPYSLHSNFQEIHDFVNSLRPSYIEPIVFSYPDEDRIFYADKDFNKRLLVFEESLRENNRDYGQEMEELRKMYCSPAREEYRTLMTDVELQKSIMQRLLPPKMPDFGEERQMMPVHFQTVERKKYKFKIERNEAEINRLRNQILLKKKLIEGERVEIIEDDQPREIVIDEEPPAIPPEKDEFSIDDPEVVEVDPFDQPARNSRGKRASFQRDRQSHFSRIAEQRLLDKVRRKLKEEEEKAAPVTRHHKENSLSKMNGPTSNEQVKEGRPRRDQPPQICSIDLDEVAKFKVLRRGSDIKNFFENNKGGVDFIEQFLQSRKEE